MGPIIPYCPGGPMSCQSAPAAKNVHLLFFCRKVNLSFKGSFTLPHCAFAKEQLIC
ncbi:unnamed protein product, partial [Staurois parvus]